MPWYHAAVLVLGVRAGVRDSVNITGVVRDAANRSAVAGAIVSVGDSSTWTDSRGRFLLRVPRITTVIEFRSSGYLSFRYPMLELRRDTFVVDAELRPDPVPPVLFMRQRGGPPALCIVREASRLVVRNGCSAVDYPKSDYIGRIIKHAPWNPYFGQAGDWDVVVFTRREQ